MHKRIYAVTAAVYLAMSIAAACRQRGKSDPAITRDATFKNDSVLQRQKDSSAVKFDTGTTVLLDTIITGQAIRISRKRDTAEDYMDFSVSGKKLRMPQGAHRGAELYAGIINIDDPTLAENSIRLRDGLLVATFDRIFRQGDLYAIRCTKDSLEALRLGGWPTVVGYNGAFFIDPLGQRVICFTPVGFKKTIPVAVLSIGKHSLKFIGAFDVNVSQYYDMNKSVVIKAYLKWEKDLFNSKPKTISQ
ncbi:MAG: hypothetical protein BGO55_21535 [Sphingobacteriales bacterium 50-39]|nr:hypothetical protein [Sphingobacteriales bacterium]OJW59573.1 MAG: hypothetical protein BGO55_21535 [Sphingobacteriales bacterium 50-39]